MPEVDECRNVGGLACEHTAERVFGARSVSKSLEHDAEVDQQAAMAGEQFERPLEKHPGRRQITAFREQVAEVEQSLAVPHGELLRQGLLDE